MKRLFRCFRKKKSCQIAKDRLKILLISDRVNCSPEIIDNIKRDITKVLSKYVKIDSENIDIQISTKTGKNGRSTRTNLCANIPIVGNYTDLGR